MRGPQGVVDSRGSFIFNLKAVEQRLQVARLGGHEIGDRLVAILGGNVYGPYERAGRVKKVYLYMLRGEPSVREAAELMWPWLGDRKRRQFALGRQDFVDETTAKDRLAPSRLRTEPLPIGLHFLSTSDRVKRVAPS